MKYLDFEGNLIEDSNKAQIDFIKLNLLIPKGSVFCRPGYGYEHFDIKDDESIRETIKSLLHNMESNDINIKSIDRSIDGTVIIKFTGSDSNITIGG
jgi:hypothetical protein